MTAVYEMQEEYDGPEALQVKDYCNGYWKQKKGKHYCFEEEGEQIVNRVGKEPRVGNCFIVSMLVLLQKK